MASRTVSVKLKADVGSYVDDVAKAAAATKLLRGEAERFDGKTYRAHLDVDTRRAERSMNRMNGELRILGSAIAALGPGAISAGSVAGAGLAGLASQLGVVAAAGGTAVAAFQGVGDALKAMREYEADPTTANLEKLREAMGNLTAEGQRFAKYLDSLRPQLRELRNVAQRGLLPGAEDGLRSLMTLMPEVSSLVDTTARAMGDLARESGEALSSDYWREYITYLESRARPTLDAIVTSSLNVARGVTGMLRAFDSSFGDDMLRSMETVTQRFANWGEKLRLSSGLHEFGEYVRQVGPQLAATLGAVARAVLAIAEAAAPIGPVVLAAIEGIAIAIEAIADSGAGPVLFGIASGLGAINLAIKSANAIKGTALVTTLAGIASSGGKASGATSKVAGALRGLGPAAVIGGLALSGIALAYDQVKSKAEEGAEAVARGSKTTAQVYEDELRRLQSRRQVMEGMQGAGYAAGQAIGEMTGKIDANAQKLKDEAEAWRITKEGQRLYLEGLPPLEAATAAASIAQNNYVDAIDRFGYGSPQAQQAQRDVAAATREAEAAQAAAAWATMSHTDRVREQSNVFLGARSAELGYAEAKARTTESVKQNGIGLDLNTEAGRRNRGALDAMAAAAVRDIEAKDKNGAKTEEVAKLTDHHRQELVDAATQMGLTKAEAIKYVEDGLGLIPKDVNTNFTVSGIDAALSEIGQLAVEIDGVYIPEGALPGPGERPGERTKGITRIYRASGGPISGPGTGTSDSIPAMLSDGEYVIRAAAARKLGRSKLDMINQRGQLPGFASGGSVSGFANITKERENGIPRWVNANFAPLADRIRADKDKVKGWKQQMMVGVGGGSQRWAPVALQALAMLGQPASLLPRVLQQIQIESGGNPRAINLWDINARRGTPSMGLIQTIMPTYLANADPRRNLGPYDPLSNLLAGMRYAIRRYGSIAAIWPKTWGYNDGGVVPGIGSRDDKLIRAQSGERVLTRSQTQAFDRLVNVLDNRHLTPVSAIAGSVRGGEGAAAPVINQEFHQVIRETVDIDLLMSRMDFAVRAITP